MLLIRFNQRSFSSIIPLITGSTMSEVHFLTAGVVLACSFLSGATGILGGAILLAYLLDSLSLSLAMVLHGVIQLSLNTFRAIFFRHYIQYKSVLPFVIGAGAAFTVLIHSPFIPSKTLAYLCLGGFGLVGITVRTIPGLGFERTGQISTAGAAVSSATVLSGVGGPILDTFFVQSKLTRLEIMGTKSVLQGFGHLIKIVFFTWQTEVNADLASAQVPLLSYICMAFVGTYLGKTCTFKMSEAFFFKVQRILIAVASSYFLYRAYTQTTPL